MATFKCAVVKRETHDLSVEDMFEMLRKFPGTVITTKINWVGEIQLTYAGKQSYISAKEKVTKHNAIHLRGHQMWQMFEAPEEMVEFLKKMIARAKARQ